MKHSTLFASLFATTMCASSFAAQSLVTANAVFIIAYETGGVVGPVLSGLAIDLWPGHGFIGFLLLSAALFAVLTLFRRNR